jgi:hypothetical protein
VDQVLLIYQRLCLRQECQLVSARRYEEKPCEDFQHVILHQSLVL